MSLQVNFIRNVTTNEVLTWDVNASSVTTHQVTNDPDNFYVKYQGGTASEPQYYIQRYNSPTQRLLAAETTACQQSNIPTSTAETIWYTELSAGGDTLTGIKLYTKTSDDKKWYLRADTFGGSADLVCSDYMNQPNYLESELMFNLVSVDVNNINNS